MRRQSNPITPHETCLELFWSKFKLTFYLPPLSTLRRSDFPGNHLAKKHYRLVSFWARALQSFYFLYFLSCECKPRNEPETSGNWTHKYPKTALLFITRFLYWTFLYLLQLSLIGIVFRHLFAFTYFHSSRRHTHATTHATGKQIVRAKMTSLDAILCRGNKSSFRSLARFCRRKHKKSTPRASRSWKNLSSTCRQV